MELVKHQKVSAFSLIIDGTTEKVLQFKCHFSQFTTKTLVSLKKKCIFEHNREVQTIKNVVLALFLQ
jgi:hypothetical protein